MELLSVHDRILPPLSIYGDKRKASALEGVAGKKARIEDRSAENESAASDYEDDEISANEYREDLNESIAATPLTSISSKASPRHPSDLHKAHHCPYSDCHKSFNRPAKLTQHLRSHTNTRPFACPHAPCAKDFLRESHLKHHIKSAHSEIRDYLCEWEGCGKSFITATRLRRHQAGHEGKEKFRCTVTACGQTFRKHGTLQKHVMTVHEGKDPFTCDKRDERGQECGLGFETEGKLNSHIGRVHGTKRFVCMMCLSDRENHNKDGFQVQLEGGFPTHAALQAHLASEHPPTCPECALKCTSQSALKSHIEVVHGGLDVGERKTYICQEPYCGRGFTKKGNLNAHIQISHTGKRFICGEVELKTLKNVGDWNGSDACGEALRSKANLEKHIRGVHLRLDPLGNAKNDDQQGLVGRSGPIPQASTLTRLTGAGYDTESGRIICCMVQDCNYRFVREYDLEIHLQSQHGLADLDIHELSERREFDNRQILLADSKTTLNHETGALDQSSVQVHDEVGISGARGSFLNGAGLWLGGYSQGGSGDGPWLYDEMEMEMEDFVDGVYMDNNHGRCNGEDVDMIDPSLV